MNIDELLKKVKCCRCEEKISEHSEHINSIALDRIANWDFPVWGNILDKSNPVRACAIFCDECVKKPIHEKEIKYAIKFNAIGEVEYIPLHILKRAPIIPNNYVAN